LVVRVEKALMIEISMHPMYWHLSPTPALSDF